MIGTFPQKCSANGRIVETVTLKEYIREKVAYHVEKNEFIGHSFGGRVEIWSAAYNNSVHADNPIRSYEESGVMA